MFILKLSCIQKVLMYVELKKIREIFYFSNAQFNYYNTKQKDLFTYLMFFFSFNKVYFKYCVCLKLLSQE